MYSIVTGNILCKPLPGDFHVQFIERRSGYRAGFALYITLGIEASAISQSTKKYQSMANVVSWFMFALGVGHILYGLVKFKASVTDAISAGFVGQFSTPEVRRTAFWFLIFGPMLMLAGHVGVHAVASGDLALLKILGAYAFVTSLIGVTALPKSPFWLALVASPLLVAAGYGWLQ